MTILGMFFRGPVSLLSCNFMMGLFIVVPSSPEVRNAWNRFLEREGNALYFTVKLQNLLNILPRIETALLKE